MFGRTIQVLTKWLLKNICLYLFYLEQINASGILKSKLIIAAIMEMKCKKE